MNRPGCVQPCPVISTAPAATTLDAQTQTALLEALADERAAQAYYSAVMTKYGQQRPFSRVIDAERHHESMVAQLCQRYGVEIPATTTPIDPTVPDTFRASCAKAADLEKLNVAMYDRFLGFIDEPDIRQVMVALRDASAQRHLPAFQRNS